MLDRTDIINLALSRLGLEGVGQPFEDTADGRRAMSLFDMERRELLHSHPWKFATRVATLYPEGAAADGIYTYDPNPAGSLRLIRLTKHGREIPWDLDEEGIKTRVLNPLCHYVWDKPAPFPEPFADALASRLALELSPWAEQSDNRQALAVMLNEAVHTAKLWDAKQGAKPRRKRALEERFDFGWERPMN